jgi:hypothetical protein
VDASGLPGVDQSGRACAAPCRLRRRPQSVACCEGHPASPRPCSAPAESPSSARAQPTAGRPGRSKEDSEVLLSLSARAKPACRALQPATGPQPGPSPRPDGALLPWQQPHCCFGGRPGPQPYRSGGVAPPLGSVGRAAESRRRGCATLPLLGTPALPADVGPAAAPPPPPHPRGCAGKRRPRH